MVITPYRSRVTRTVLAAVGVTAGLLLIFGGRHWHATPSLHWLAQAPIPLQAWGVAFCLYALLLILDTDTRPLGYALGTFLFAVFTISLAATVETPDPKNVVSVGAMIDCTVFHAFSIRTAWVARELRKERS